MHLIETLAIMYPIEIKIKFVYQNEIVDIIYIMFMQCTECIVAVGYIFNFELGSEKQSGCILLFDLLYKLNACYTFARSMSLYLLHHLCLGFMISLPSNVTIESELIL